MPDEMTATQLLEQGSKRKECSKRTNLFGFDGAGLVAKIARLEISRVLTNTISGRCSRIRPILLSDKGVHHELPSSRSPSRTCTTCRSGCECLSRSAAKTDHIRFDVPGRAEV